MININIIIYETINNEKNVFINFMDKDGKFFNFHNIGWKIDNHLQSGTYEYYNYINKLNINKNIKDEINRYLLNYLKLNKSNNQSLQFNNIIVEDVFGNKQLGVSSN